MNVQNKAIVPGVQNSTVVLNRPSLTRSETFVREADKTGAEGSSTPDQTQNVDIGNNLTQNVMTKLKEQTFAVRHLNRMSISPIHNIHTSFIPDKISGSTKFAFGDGKSPDETIRLSAINSTPCARSAPMPIDKISTKYLYDQKVLPPLSFDVTGTDLESLSPLQITPPAQLNSTKKISITDAITQPESMDSLPVISHLPAQEKFHLLTKDMIKDDLIADTTLNLSTTFLNCTTQPPRMSINLMNFSTTQSTTMIQCDAEESQNENTLVPSKTVDEERMEVDDRENSISCGELKT